MRKSLLLIGIALTFMGISGTSSIAEEMCPALHAPVCAVDGTGMRKTYDNSCRAKVAGARLLHVGDCQVPGNGDICGMIYMPVCAVDPKTNQKRTYTNNCGAEVANATFVSDGKCPTGN